MDFELPQGSIVGPGSFKIYILPIRKHGICYHMYADDIQLYLKFDPSDHATIQSAFSRPGTCITEVKQWMTNNLFKLNDNKTEFFVAISAHNKRNMPSDVHLQIGTEIVHPSETVHNLGVIFDSQMSNVPTDHKLGQQCNRSSSKHHPYSSVSWQRHKYMPPHSKISGVITTGLWKCIASGINYIWQT